MSNSPENLLYEKEAAFTRVRARELELNPVKGIFDAAHLREINRRLFQDLPANGFKDVTPGEYRTPAPEGKDWVKQRGLETVNGSFFVAYSSMDLASQKRLDQTLESIKPDELLKLDLKTFTEKMSKLYTELDYIHPFTDGNSRTLRSFTTQLAKESGFNLNWEHFTKSPNGRDELYIARDLAVNELSKPHIQHENTMRKVVFSMDVLENSADLNTILNSAITEQKQDIPLTIAESEQTPNDQNLKLDQFVGEKFNELIKAEEAARPNDHKLNAFIDRLDDGNHEIGSTAHNVAVGRDIRLKTDFAASGEDFPVGVPELMNQASQHGLSRLEQDFLPVQQYSEPNPNAPCIGSKMTTSDYTSAMTKIGGDSLGKIDCPKSGGAYSGKIIQLSDTHVVQQVGKNIAIAHDIKQLSNSAELLNLAVAGKLKGKLFDINYSNALGSVSQSRTQPVKANTIIAPLAISQSQNIKR